MSGWDTLKSTNTTLFPLSGSTPCWKLTTPGTNAWDSLITALESGWLDNQAANGYSLGGLGNLTMSGTFANPSQPGIEAYNAAGFSLPNAAWTAIPLDTQGNYNVGGMHSTTVNNTRETCAAAGTYLVGGMIGMPGSTAGINRGVKIYKNGSALAGFPFAQVGPDSVSNQFYIPTGATPVLLAMSDYIELYAYQDTGSAMTLLSGYCRLFAYKIG